MLNTLKLIQVHEKICSATALPDASEFSQYAYLPNEESTDLALRSMGSPFFYRQIGCFKQTYASKACILRLNEHGMPEACFFFSGMKWHIVRAHVSAKMTGPPHASSALCMVPHAAFLSQNSLFNGRKT